MNQDKRLYKLEGALTSKQAMVLWLQEIQHCNNALELVQFLRGQTEVTASVSQLFVKVERATRSNMKGRSEVIIRGAVHRSFRDVLFLIRLHRQVNFKVMEEQRAWNVSTAALAGMMQNLLTENSFSDLLGYVRCYIEDHSFHTSPHADEDIQCREQLLSRLHLWHSQRNLEEELITEWKSVAQGFLIELYGFQDAIAFISKSYFDCHPVLFPDLVQVLTDIVKKSEEMVGMLNDTFREKASKDLIIDLEALHKAAIKEADEQTSYLVDLVKAETMALLGDQHAAGELAVRHLEILNQVQVDHK